METRTTIYFALLLSLVVATGCNTSQSYSSHWLRAEQAVAEREAAYTNGMSWPPNVSSNELVMTLGMRINARSNGEEITIESGQGFNRSYSWDGETRAAKLWPRVERWYGNRGIYFPGSGEHWRSNNGITRGVLQEGVLWFQTLGATTNWLRTIQPLKNCVYTDAGLVVAWEKTLERKQINVDVWQLMIGGQKPESLPGSSNQQILLTQATR